MDKTESEELSRDLIRAMLQFKRMMMRHNTHFGHEPGRREHMHHGMKNSEVMFLFRLKELEEEYPEGIGISEMSERMMVRPPSVTSVVTSLEEKGFTERRMDPGDRRKIHIRLTDAGNDFVLSNRKRLLMQVQGLVEYLGPEKSAALASLLGEAFRYYSAEHRCSGDEQ